jgi:hypothetical protein
MFDDTPRYIAEGRSAIDAIFDKRARWVTVLVLMGLAFVAGAILF